MNAKQNWSVGAVVRVGFLTLRVIGFVPTPGNYSPDEWALESMKGDKFYTFTPHRGLFRVATREAAFTPNF